MAVASRTEPNYEAAFASYSIPKGPVVTSASAPGDTTFVDSLNGLNQAIYPYGGYVDSITRRFPMYAKGGY